MQESVTLYYCEGASDKVYQASLQPRDGGFVVLFAYGRRGSALATGSKTAQPLPYPQARTVYQRLVQSKLARGYQPGAARLQAPHEARAERDSGLRPQLLNPIPSERLPLLVRDPGWAMQEKHDGVRLLLRKLASGAVEGVNRQGRFTPVPPLIRLAAEALPGTFVLDGECVGEDYHAFDLLEAAGSSLRRLPYHARLFQLTHLLADADRVLRQVVTATTTATKSALLEELQRSDREGVVFKRLEAPYEAGRPSSGGDALKWKFYATASFIVQGLNAQRSASLVLLDDLQVPRPAGNVTIPPNQPVPTPGDIVEVRYLYAFPESGAVYQPVYRGRRTDLSRSDCTRDQLKFKPELAAA